MNTFDAIFMGELNRGKELMVFDWDKAAEIIQKIHPKYASAYLAGDREYTEGVIYEDGRIIDRDDPYLASTWAEPTLEISLEEGKYEELGFFSTSVPCYRMEHEVPMWGPKTIWPESARKILKGGDNE